MKTSLLLCSFFIANLLVLHSQNLIKADFSPSSWDVKAEKYEFKEFKGKSSLYLEKGVVRLKDSNFKNGIIEYDVNMADERKFIGIHFRITSGRSYEEFYLRPHQSGNQDAMQYTPVFNGITGWQIYQGPAHGARYNYNFDEWIHVRLVINNSKMDVFINDMSQPVLKAHSLKKEVGAGQIGFSSVMGGAHFANLSYQNLNNASISRSEKLPVVRVGTIKKWSVSEVFDINPTPSITNLNSLPGFKKMNWQSRETENTGLINLARFSGLSNKANTMLVKVVVNSSKRQIKRLDFGYSDIARVFVHNKLVYSGQRIFRSRDYRYLGSIGYFDAVYLDLKKGKNVVVFAITENFGGWGLQASFENLDGITLVY